MPQPDWIESTTGLNWANDRRSMNTRFRRLTELFVRGKAVPLPDGTYLWVQVINAYERDECLSDAQVSRSRMILALKKDGEERIKVKARLAELGHEAMGAQLARSRSEGKMSDFADQMRADPDWKERMDILMRTDFETAAKPPTIEETALIATINDEVLSELIKRENDERAFLERRYERMSEEDLIDEWAEEWMERKGATLSAQDYRLTELWYATRYCEAVTTDTDELDHSLCNGHSEKVFETKQDARSAPSELSELLRAALDELNMAGRDPKDSDSPTNSSASSPTPSAPEESTPSTSTETPATVPGT